MLVTHVDIVEDSLKNTPFTAGRLYYCSDTGNVYYDSENTNSRVKVSTDTIIVATEQARQNILAPIPNKVYCVLSSGRLYIYNEDWIRLGKTNFEIVDVVIENGTLVVNNSEIRADNVARFVPDLSVADLVDSSTLSAVCTDGKVTVTYDSEYSIPGRIIID